MEVPALPGDGAGGFSIRACSKSWYESLESVVGWTDYMLGTSTALCFGDRGGGKCSQGCQMFREAMTPRYMPTDIEELEERRTSLLLSLTGQFTVVLFRVATGHWSSAVIGLVVFAVGNRARCSLQNTTLTSFVVLGFGTGLLDSVDLLQNILFHGTHFFVLPLEFNLYQDLWAIALTLAPISEVSGARLAWDSFLQPELLLRPSRQTNVQTVQCHPGYGPPPSPWSQMGLGQAAPFMQHPGWQWQGPAQPPQGTPWKHQAEWYGHHAPPGVAQEGGAGSSLSWSSAAYRAIFGRSSEAGPGEEGDDCDDGRSEAGRSVSSNSGSIYSARRQVHRRKNCSTGGDSQGRQGSHLGPLSSTELVNDFMSDNDEEERLCVQCGDGVPAFEARAMAGTGNFAENVYCQACWRAWSS